VNFKRIIRMWNKVFKVRHIVCFKKIPIASKYNCKIFFTKEEIVPKIIGGAAATFARAAKQALFGLSTKDTKIQFVNQFLHIYQ